MAFMTNNDKRITAYQLYMGVNASLRENDPGFTPVYAQDLIEEARKARELDERQKT